jgi:hypothetical protein
VRHAAGATEGELAALPGTSSTSIMPIALSRNAYSYARSQSRANLHISSSSGGGCRVKHPVLCCAVLCGAVLCGAVYCAGLPDTGANAGSQAASTYALQCTTTHNQSRAHTHKNTHTHTHTQNRAQALVNINRHKHKTPHCCSSNQLLRPYCTFQ